MSYKNPKAAEIVANSTGDIRVLMDHKLAIGDFFKKHGRKPTLDDAQELRDLNHSRWYDWYVGDPLKKKLNRVKSKPVWEYGIKFGIDVSYELCRWLEIRYSTWQHRPERAFGVKSWPDKNCSVLMKEMGITFIDGYIMDNDLLNEWKQYIDTSHTTLKKYQKSVYKDWSHIAYNNSSDDL